MQWCECPDVVRHRALAGGYALLAAVIRQDFLDAAERCIARLEWLLQVGNILCFKFGGSQNQDKANMAL